MKTDKDWIVNGPAYAKVNNKYYCNGCGCDLSPAFIATISNYCYCCNGHRPFFYSIPARNRLPSIFKHMNWVIADADTIPNPTGGKE